MLSRYVKYSDAMFTCALTPNNSSKAFSACPLMCPLYLAIMASAGLPGMRRGMTKFTVTAAHIVKRKKPVLLKMNLILHASFPGSLRQGGQQRSEEHTSELQSTMYL